MKENDAQDAGQKTDGAGDQEEARTSKQRDPSTCSSNGTTADKPLGYGGESDSFEGKDDRPYDDDDDDDDDDNASTGPRFPIRRSQRDRFFAVYNLLQRIVEALWDNIRRVEMAEDEASACLVHHFWQEAARLKGTEKIVLPRLLVEPEGWWVKLADADNSGGGGGRGDAGRDTEGASGSDNGHTVTGGRMGRRKSMLCRASVPDDLLWDDAVSQWRLDLGLAVDEKGRRRLKI
ncbi:hypothetical protein SPI_07552 [Niveomyces insectorum RCEF 264]|uniref:Uncharacterized protein n=1 Tax=Niveomyces insectorum RCEF 264 TaxID=1081102 RepID=A0A162IFT5_9HYPO|nr:hypothetical protein SPI_07552 [Niveomyces insectorum RCEF 264]